jgi:hypothetical protein
MDETPSAWAIGWALFAAIMLMIAGMFQIVAGLVAIIEDEFYVTGAKWVFEFDTTTWGWIHLVWGIVLILVGVGILTGNLAARIVGVIAAGISALANFVFLPYYPVWAIIIISVDIAIIWALTAHGRDVEMVEQA